MFVFGFIWLNMQMTVTFLLVIILARITATNDNIPDKNERTLDNQPRIVGGSTATIDEIPFQVSIRKRSSERIVAGSGHFCGGSLISRRAVLTAAHCCFKPFPYRKRSINEYLLVMGNTYLNRHSSTEKQYLVVDIRVHNLYSLITFTNDIALMFIDGVVPSSSLVRPIKLNKRPVNAGTMCQVSGWGKTVDANNAGASSELRRASVPILDTNDCSRVYLKLSISSQICAGYMEGNIDSCQGDSGGPLECGDELVGVVSYGNGCAMANYPGVYQSVFYYNNWIEQQNSTFDYTRYAHTKSFADVLVASFGRCWHCLALLAAFLYDAIY